MLAERALSHRDQRFESLYRRYFWSLVGFCRASLRSRAAAEDAAQEAFFRAFRYLEALDASRSPWPWLKGIARNVIADRARRESRETPVEAPEAGATSPTEAADSSMAFTEAMSALAPRHRLALYLRYVEGLEPSAAAERLSLSIAAFNQLLFRARGKLKAELRRLGEAVPVLVLAPTQWIRTRMRRLASRLSERSPGPAGRLGPEMLMHVVKGIVAFAMVFGSTRGPAGATEEHRVVMPTETVAMATLASSDPAEDRPSQMRADRWVEQAREARQQQAQAPVAGDGNKVQLDLVVTVQNVAGQATKKGGGGIKFSNIPNPVGVAEKAACLTGLCDTVSKGAPSPTDLVDELPVDLPAAP